MLGLHHLGSDLEVGVVMHDRPLVLSCAEGHARVMTREQRRTSRRMPSPIEEVRRMLTGIFGWLVRPATGTCCTPAATPPARLLAPTAPA